MRLLTLRRAREAGSGLALAAPILCVELESIYNLQLGKVFFLSVSGWEVDLLYFGVWGWRVGMVGWSF
jgi:hypothetical protein